MRVDFLFVFKPEGVNIPSRNDLSLVKQINNDMGKSIPFSVLLGYDLVIYFFSASKWLD